MPYYKAEVMRLHSITSDEYDSRTLEGDRSIYLPQPNPMFEPTRYDERVARCFRTQLPRSAGQIQAGRTLAQKSRL